MNTERTTPDTIVLIHGFWVTPREAGRTGRPATKAAAIASSAPAYPGFEVEVEALNADLTPIVEPRFPRSWSISSPSSPSSKHLRS